MSGYYPADDAYDVANPLRQIAQALEKLSKLPELPELPAEGDEPQLKPLPRLPLAVDLLASHQADLCGALVANAYLTASQIAAAVTSKVCEQIDQAESLDELRALYEPPEAPTEPPPAEQYADLIEAARAVSAMPQSSFLRNLEEEAIGISSPPALVCSNAIHKLLDEVEKLAGRALR